MVAARQLEPYMTIEEYLERERLSNDRHEYVDGRAYMMAGARENHNAIKSSAEISIGAQLLKRPCKTYSSDMKVETPSGLVGYPDIIVVCGEPQMRDSKRDVLLNPIVIIEVLSNSTELFDRTTKWSGYQTIPSLKEYLLVSQYTRKIEHYVRQHGDEWQYQEFTQADTVIALPSIDCTLALADVYAKVTLP
jgi:Uma2 family endonuclease